MIIKELKPKQALNKAFLKLKPNRTDIERFKANLIQLLERTNDTESEEFHKNLVSDFLKKTYYEPNHFINTKGRNDLVIHNGQQSHSPVSVIIEAKKPTNKSEMISTEKLNAKAFQKLILYYLRERITHKNLEVKHLIVTNVLEWFIFDATLFERLFAQNKHLLKQFEDFENARLADTKTEFFYKQIAEPFIANLNTEIEFAYFNFQDYQKLLHNADKADDKQLIALFKLLSPEHLLKLPFANDSNSLDKRFYGELLHIIGLTETKAGSRKLIERNKEAERNTGSLLEDSIIQLDSLDKISRLAKPALFGNTYQERLFNVALELTLTWINRILFLKLLEAQLISYHKTDKSYSFLNLEKIKNYTDLNSLFFQVLARKHEQRNQDVKQLFEKVPYLNSSLFEPTELEQITLIISSLNHNKTLPIFAQTVLKDAQGKKLSGELNTLEYLFRFLEAYDFSNEGSEAIQEDNKTLINAAVLGLIFEKINGYKDGSFFTPGFITMYMSRETLRKAVVQKFNHYCQSQNLQHGEINSLEDIYELIPQKISRKQANDIINSLKICDPAVGSGHFLVSALNEIIAIKNDVGILLNFEGRWLKDYLVEVHNDALYITEKESGEEFYYLAPSPRATDRLEQNNYTFKSSHLSERQIIQQSIFKEKQFLIENCLFGVDINPNSVKICRLRLWIELLKNAYYTPESNFTELETLPNIDINIKCGNSLISRFAIDADLGQALEKKKWTIDSYRLTVDSYRNAKNREHKREMERLITDIKSDFRTEIFANDPKVKKLQKLKDELFQMQNQIQLFEMTKKEKSDWNKKEVKLSAEISKLDAEIEAIKTSKIFENAFEWRFEFPEVLNDNGDFVGFDIVIGNPPYGLIFTELEKKFIKTTYSFTDYQFDIYMSFFEKSYCLLKNFCHLSLIVPNTWLLNLKSPNIRNLLFNQFNTEKIRVYNFPVFDEAIVDTLIVCSSKEKPQHGNILIEIIDKNNNLIENHFSHQELSINYQIPINIYLSDFASKIVDKLSELKKFHVVSKITQGTKPFQKGKGNPKQDDNILREKPYIQKYKKDETFRPLLRGSLINKYAINWNKNYYISFGDWLAEPRYSADYDAKCKIIVRQTGSSLIAALDERKFIIRDNLYAIISTDKNYSEHFLLACLNSRLLNWYYQNVVNNEVGEALAQVKKGHIEILPVPNFNQEIFAELNKLVKDILKLKEIHSKTNTQDIENQIDQLIYKLYNLTEEEIKIIEKSK